jgi:integrase
VEEALEQDGGLLVADAQTADPQWRCLIALSRFGALRTPSESLALRWEHVNWSEGRITIMSSKTAGQGRASRAIPLYPELRPHLLAAFEAAERGAEFVITRYRDSASNLRTQFERLLTRAGLVAWPRLWHNMRASRATELAAEFPSFVAAAWCGHTETIANQHYRMVRDEDFARATSRGSESGAQVAQNAAQHRNAPRRTEPKQVA